MSATPPQIVDRAPDPEAALAAFIAQELERWGFEITDSYSGDGHTLEVSTPGRNYRVTVE